MRAQRSAGAPEAARATHAARTRAPRCHLQDLTRRPHPHRHGRNHARRLPSARDHCHHAGSPAPQCRILAYSLPAEYVLVPPRLCVRVPAHGTASYGHQVADRLHGTCHFAGALSVTSAVVRLGLSGASPQLDRRLGPWMASGLLGAFAAALSRLMYRITCPSRTRPHARSQVLAIRRSVMYRITAHYPVVHRPVVFREAEQQLLAHEPWERWLVDGDVRSGRSDDAVAVNGDSPYRFG
jgi:hypothetical protein